VPGYDTEFERGLFGAPDGNSMAGHREHAIVVAWLFVLGTVRWPMLVTVLTQLRQGLLALPPERLVSRLARAILTDLACRPGRADQ
jgi:hypothetical protein